MKLIKYPAILAVLLLALAAGAQTKQSQPQVPPEVLDRIAQEDWFTADLKLDNQPYATIRAALDKRIAKGESPAFLEREFRLQGQDIYDSQKIFRWAYAAYRKQKLAPNQTLYSEINAAMDRNGKPGAYDWVRLRFLVSSSQGFLRPTAELIQVGRRLFEVRDDDEEVLFQWIHNLQNSESLDERKLSLEFAREEVRKRPKDGYWQLLLANSVRSIVGYATPIPPYKDMQWQIFEYTKALKLLPANYPGRSGIIKSIVLKRLFYDKNKKLYIPTQKEIDEAVKNTTLR